MAYGFRTKRRRGTIPWINVLLVATVPAVWAWLHNTLVVQWTPGPSWLLNSITLLIAGLMVILFSMNDDPDLRSSVRDYLLEIGFVLFLGMVAGWLMSNAALWRVIGAFLVGLENFGEIEVIKRDRPGDVRLWISYAALALSPSLGCTGCLRFSTGSPASYALSSRKTYYKRRCTTKYPDTIGTGRIAIRPDPERNLRCSTSFSLESFSRI